MSNVQGGFAPSYSIGHTVVRGGGDVVNHDDYGDMPPFDTPLPTRPPRARIGAERGSSELCHAWEQRDWKPTHPRDSREGKRLIDCRTPVPGFPTHERSMPLPPTVIYVPTESPECAPKACPPKDCGPQESGVRWGTVTVQPGDDLAKIAREHGTTWQHIYDANRGEISDPNLIHPGQKLRVPVGETWEQGCAPKAPACEPAPPKCEPPLQKQCDMPAPPKNDCPPPAAPAPAPCPPAPCPPGQRPNNDAARVLGVIGGVLGGIANGFGGARMNGGYGMNGGFGMSGGFGVNGGIGMTGGMRGPMPMGPVPMGPVMGPMPMGPVGIGGLPIAGPAPMGQMPGPIMTGPVPMGPPMKGPVAGPPQKF